VSFSLSVLDQSPIPAGSTNGRALRNSIELAQLADALGYERYWLAEHHGTPGLACNSPEVMIGPVAAATSRIRVGSGGVMLPHYSPLKVAESFHMLSGLFPGRIDLGVGRAPGTSARVAHFLQRDRRHPPPDDFREQLEELLGYLSRPNSPEPFLLGSSPQSAIWAAELGLPYVFADFINPAGEPFAAFYREHFQPSARLEKPRTAVCVWAVCAETDAEAFRLSLSARMMMLLLFRGQLIPVPPVEQAEAFLEQEGLPPETLPAGRRIIAGSPATVRRAIEAVAKDYGADEVFAVNILYDHAARLRSYELLAEAFALRQAAAESAPGTASPHR
jgi:luciferase family oxidoreductase group 1